MKEVLVIHLARDEQETESIEFLEQQIQIRRIGCGGDLDLAKKWIHQFDGQADAIGVEGMPAQLALGSARRAHDLGVQLAAAAQHTPLVDGSGVRSGLERWGVILADRAQPGIFSKKHILMVPGLNHEGLIQALLKHSSKIRYADPVVYFALPDFPGVGSQQMLEQVAGPTLVQLKRLLSAGYFPVRASLERHAPEGHLSGRMF